MANLSRSAYRKVRSVMRKNGAWSAWIARGREDYLADRAALVQKVNEMAQRGRVAIVTNGMDCDCATWENRVSYVPAIPRAVEKWLDGFYADAEGPQGHYITKPSRARSLKSSSRDLALEARENGHDHVVYY